MSKKNRFIIIPVIIILCLLFLFSLFNRNEKIAENNKLKVCYALDNCKTLDTVPKEAINNIIGYPNNFHQESSIIHIDTQADFDKGRFDEKAFYFSYKNNVYYFINAKILTGFSEDAGLLINSDAKTFQLIDANFSKDKNNVYAKENIDSPVATQILTDADPQTFSTLDWPYARDNKNIFYLNKKIVEANAGSFKILENKLCGQDKNNYYKNGQISNEEQCK